MMKNEKTKTRSKKTSKRSTRAPGATEMAGPSHLRHRHCPLPTRPLSQRRLGPEAILRVAGDRLQRYLRALVGKRPHRGVQQPPARASDKDGS
ncbi:hypothetical protein GCM10027259_33140 [Micromonospora palomenae]